MKKKKIIEKWLADEIPNMPLEGDTEDSKRLNKIQKELDTYKAGSFNAAEELEKFHATRKDNQSIHVTMNLSKWALRIAASSLLLAVGYFIFNNQKQDKIGEVALSTGVGEQQVIYLPDSSKVSLNANSSITYVLNDWAQNRTISLEGEAFFEVKQGSSFVVSSVFGKVMVLGTKFNVKDRKNLYEVSCFEGKVNVAVADASNYLISGNKITFFENQLLKSDFKIKENSPAWTNDRSEFRSIPLYLVLEELERQFGVNVSVKNLDTLQRFTGNFLNRDLIIALEAISKSTGTVYQIDEEKMVLLQGEVP